MWIMSKGASKTSNYKEKSNTYSNFVSNNQQNNNNIAYLCPTNWTRKGAFYPIDWIKHVYFYPTD